MLVGIELSFAIKSETIDTSELLILRISSPVGSCELIELERVLWNLVRELDMRPLTHIDEGCSRVFTKIGESSIYRILEFPDIRIKTYYRFSLLLELIHHFYLIDLAECREK